MADIFTNLEELGYEFKSMGNTYRSKALYRNGENPISLCLFPETFTFYDHSNKKRGSLNELYKLTLKKLNPELTYKEISDTLSQKVEAVSVEEEKIDNKIKIPKEYPSDSLNKLEKDHSFWINRGISEETLKVFEGGVAKQGPMKNRYVFPIKDSAGKIIGFSGRYLFKNDKLPKWKHFPTKKLWRYPAFYNSKELQKSNHIILVESIGDFLSLWEAGIKNVLVCFTNSVSCGIMNYLSRLDPDQVVIAFNNDFEKYENHGKIQAVSSAKKLLAYFDREQIRINLPPKNDFNEMNKEEILLWHKKLTN
tara:strand:- start:9147 stop:10070 length:924 start_codon:yes stop_codon:yes gene_type:complete